MLVISSLASIIGMVFLSMSTPPALAIFTGTCKQYEPQCIGHTHKILLHTGFAFLTLGISGSVPLEPYIKENMDNMYKSRGIIGITILFLGTLFSIVGAIGLPYINSWLLQFLIPGICTLVATIVFLSGWFKYPKIEPKGSPLTNVCRVFMASISKICHPFPPDHQELYSRDGEEIKTFTHTRILRCLGKAAIILPNESRQEQEENRWKLCSVAEVEEAKIVVRMVPMWMTFLLIGIVSSIGNTYFLAQANHLNRKLGAWNVPLPICLLLFNAIKYIFNKCYGCIELFTSFTNCYAPSVSIAVAMIFSVVCCIAGALTELRRLKVIQTHGLLDKPDEDIPMSIYWLLFELFLLAGLEAFSRKGIAQFYYDQAPRSMKNYLFYFTQGITGLGYMFSVVSVYVVGKISEIGKRQNWFQPTLNRSRLDRYYWVLAALSAVNLIVFIVVASNYRYKKTGMEEEDDAIDEGEDEGCTLPFGSITCCCG